MAGVDSKELERIAGHFSHNRRIDLLQMSTIGILFATISGSTREQAKDVANKLDLNQKHVHDLLETSLEVMDQYETILIGSPTYGRGDCHYLFNDGIPELLQQFSKRKNIGIFVMGDLKSHRKTFGGGLFRLYEKLDLATHRLVGGIPVNLYDHAFPDWEEALLPGLIVDKHGSKRNNQARMDVWLAEVKHVALEPLYTGKTS